MTLTVGKGAGAVTYGRGRSAGGGYTLQAGGTVSNRRGALAAQRLARNLREQQDAQKQNAETVDARQQQLQYEQSTGSRSTIVGNQIIPLADADKNQVSTGVVNPFIRQSVFLAQANSLSQTQQQNKQNQTSQASTSNQTPKVTNQYQKYAASIGEFFSRAGQQGTELSNREEASARNESNNRFNRGVNALAVFPTRAISYGSKAVGSTFQQYSESNTGLGRDITIQTAFGGAAGIGTGKVVNTVGRTYGVRAAAYTEKAIGLGGITLLGSQLYGKSPEEVGKALPGIAAGGYVGYKTYVAEKPGIIVDRISALRTSTSQVKYTDTTVGGIVQSRGSAVVSEFGNPREIQFDTTSLITGSKAPQSSYYNVNVDTYGQIKAAKPIPLSQNFQGVLTRREIGLVDNNGRFFISKLGKSSNYVSEFAPVAERPLAKGFYDVNTQGYPVIIEPTSFRPKPITKPVIELKQSLARFALYDVYGGSRVPRSVGAAQSIYESNPYVRRFSGLAKQQPRTFRAADIEVSVPYSVKLLQLSTEKTRYVEAKSTSGAGTEYVIPRNVYDKFYTGEAYNTLVRQGKINARQFEGQRTKFRIQPFNKRASVTLMGQEFTRELPSTKTPFGEFDRPVDITGLPIGLERAYRQGTFTSFFAVPQLQYQLPNKIREMVTTPKNNIPIPTPAITKPRADVRQLNLPRNSIAPVTLRRSIQSLRTDVSTPENFAPSLGNPNLPNLRDDIPFPLSFPNMPGGGYQGFGFRSGKSYRAKSAYTPSLYALEFGIFTKAKNLRASQFSGLEVRAVPISIAKRLRNNYKIPVISPRKRR